MTGIRVKARVALVVAFTLLVSLLGPLAHQVEATPAQTGPPSSMDALGDSITRGYNTAGFFVDNVAQSWSSGTDTGVNSIYRRILALNPAISGKNFNDAVTGAKMSGLDGQAANAVARNPELVTILLGANDVCASSEAAMTSVATFRAQLLTGMQRLSTNLPNSRIFVSSIPNIFNLWNVLRTNATARSTWSLFGICQAMLANSNSTAAADVARRARVQQRNIDFNTQLSEVCAQFIHCRFDNNAAYNLSFLSTDVSTWDYFHPNTAGQTKAAATLWNAGFNYSDTTAPNTTITTDRGADGVDGWYRNDVTVSLSSTDNVAVSGSEFFYQLQGAAGTLPWTRYTGPFTINTAGITNITARTVDVNGNIDASKALAVKIDKTAPTLSITCPSGNVPRNSAATSTVTATDALSGFAVDPSGTFPVDTSTLGVNPHQVTVADRAGNSTTKSCSYTVVDVTAPTISIAAPVSGQSIARDAAVAADFSCADETGGSGLATCVGTVADGANIDTAALGDHSFTVNAKDNAGNTSTKTVHYSVVDETPPSITISSPTDGQTIAQHEAVAADYGCTDEASGSGLATCVGTVANGADIDTSTLGSHDFTVNASDNAGNTSTKTVTYNVVDVTAPTIDISSPVDNATISRDAAVAAGYSCADEAAGSGVATCVGTVANGADIDTSTLGSHDFTVNASDNAGNTSTKTVTYTVVDVTPPTITITTPADGSSVARGAVVAADYACADEAGGSGVASCVGTTANGSNIDTSTLGSHSFKVDAK
ncbi:MAG: hypothetical protein JWM05_1013, partial [Acidimicrobiales bacterium]|nr:hypothetical protein [Acidimicrobiales bacterium]